MRSRTGFRGTNPSPPDVTDQPSVILLDIEGTTSSISFVADELFPYARKHMADFLQNPSEDISAILATVPGDPLETLVRWIDEDRKETALKAIQGMIWRKGYEAGELSGHVYPDTPEALVRWTAMGIPVCIYSSGSIEAQKLIFGNSVAGDLTPLLSGHFDTTTGPKREAESYVKIADALGREPGEVLFVSDIQAEIDAARDAGMQAVLIDRDTGKGEVSSLAEVVP